MARKRPAPPKKKHRKKPRQLLTGTMRVIRAGQASVETPEGIFRVGRNGMHEAMHGDTVEISISTFRGEKLACVQHVVTRATTSFLGRYELADPLGVIVPLDGRISHDFFVPSDDPAPGRLGVAAGDIVVARIVEYPTRKSAAVATIERRVGAGSELDVPLEALIASYGLPTEFSPAALAQAETLSLDVEQALAAEPDREDLRDLLAVTVDPADARDYDDAVGAVRCADGYELWVHIADVSAYVAWNDAIDNEAKQRACSVYLVDRVLPMLPVQLSNELCSLKPHEDRLAMSVHMRLDRSGRIVDAKAMSSAVRSSARLSYDEVDAMLCGERPAPTREIGEAISVLDEIRSLREHLRVQRGSIDFETVEAKVILDEDGMPTGVSVRTRTPATSLIEEAMLAANESVAGLLAAADVPSAFRVHEFPSPDDLKTTILPLRELGLIQGEEAAGLAAGDPFAIQAVLERAKGTPGGELASALLLRAQKRAIYLPRNEGHYALAAPAYCHFTAPIRRYPDLIVHRSLKALLRGQLGSREQAEIQKQLSQICRSCSDQERVADAAARDSQDIKMAEFYKPRIGASFSGVVSGCTGYGLFVTLDGTHAEGLLPIRALGDEWFDYDEARLTLTSTATGAVWRLGKRIAVKVEGVDIARGRIDFALAHGEPQGHN
ncbi:ribonuclease R [Coriobacteriales bacterium OH1046]|nr:ribonuclease R [Coriobacteriales bacterium OH1046]